MTQDPQYRTGWGLYDDTLLDMVYSRFESLSKRNKKFALFTLTLDTHPPSGHPSTRCNCIKYGDGTNPMLNAVACSDRLISEFINKIIRSPYADKTIIAIASDHLSLKNTASGLLGKKKRRNLFFIIDPKIMKPRVIETKGSQLDIGTTLLPFIGYSGGFGLGQNLLGDSIDLEKHWKTLKGNLKRWKEPVLKFWDFPKIEKTISINIKKQQVHIDDRTFRIPVLIELDDSLNAVMKFQFDRSSSHKTLVEHCLSMDKNKYFMLIDRCWNAKVLDGSLSGLGYCLIVGNGNKLFHVKKLNSDLSISYDDILTMLNLPGKSVSISSL